MAKCSVCDKAAHFGIKVSHSHRRSNRMWKSNVKSVKAIVDGTPKNPKKKKKKQNTKENLRLHKVLKSRQGRTCLILNKDEKKKTDDSVFFYCNDVWDIVTLQLYPISTIRFYLLQKNIYDKSNKMVITRNSIKPSTR